MANRTIKELLQLTLDHLKEMNLDGHGLCHVILNMTNTSDEEYWVLKNYLHGNLPKQKYTKQQAYKWKPGTKTCRIKWLTKQINSLAHGKH